MSFILAPCEHILTTDFLNLKLYLLLKNAFLDILFHNNRSKKLIACDSSRPIFMLDILSNKLTLKMHKMFVFAGVGHVHLKWVEYIIEWGLRNSIFFISFSCIYMQRNRLAMLISSAECAILINGHRIICWWCIWCCVIIITYMCVQVYTHPTTSHYCVSYYPFLLW